ncbi:MAG TPA: hypothetical protein VIO94_16950 [Phenylobacterium sp.]
MLRRALFALAPLAFLGAPARAAEKAEPAPTGPWVDLSPVGLPVLVDGELVNYVFVYVRINFSRTADSMRLRDKEPYFRDALIRAAYRTPFTRPDDFASLDSARLAATLRREAGLIATPKDIAGVVVLKQTPKRRTGLPRPKARA